MAFRKLSWNSSEGLGREGVIFLWGWEWEGHTSFCVLSSLTVKRVFDFFLHDNSIEHKSPSKLA